MPTQSQEVQTEEFVVEAAPDERDTRIEELEAKVCITAHATLFVLDHDNHSLTHMCSSCER